MERLNQQMEFDEKLIDPAPFQLVRRTSLYKVHSVFSLLGLNRAYVTDRGRLVGVVALRDVRIAIQNAQNGVPLSSSSSSNTMSSDDSSNFDREADLANETNLENGSESIQKTDGNGLMSFRVSNTNEFEAPHHVAQEFKAAIERRRRISDDRSGVDVSSNKAN
jgi:chloride channel 2